MAETDLVIKLIGEQKSVVENINAIIKRLDALSAQINKTAKGAKTGNEELGQSAEGMGKQTGDVYESISRKANKFQQILYMTGNTSSGVATKMVHYAGVLSTVKSRFSGVEIAISGVIAVIGLLITWVMKETEAEKEAKEIIKIKTKNVEELIKKTEEYTKKIKEKNTGQSEEVGITRDLTSEIADHEKEQSRLNDLIVWMNNLGAPKFMTGLGALEEKYKQQTKELKLLRDAQADYNQELEDNLFLQTQVDIATSQSKKDKRLVEDMKVLKASQEKIKTALKESTQFRVELERSFMEESEKLWYEYLDKVKEAEKLKYKDIGEKEQTLYLLRQSYLKKITDAQQKEDNEYYKRMVEGNALDAKLMKQKKEYFEIRKTKAEEAVENLKELQATSAYQPKEGEKETGIVAWGKTIATGFLEELGRKGVDIVSNMVSFAFKPYEQIMGLLSMAFSGEGVDAVKQATDTAISLFENIAKNLGPVLEYLITEGIPRIIDAFVTNLPTIVNAIVTYLPDLVITLIDSIPVIANAIIAEIPRIIFAFIGHIPEIIGALVKAIFGMLSGEGGVPILSSIPGIGGLFKGGIIPGVDIIPNSIPLIGGLFHKGGMVGNAMDSFVGSVGMFKDAMRAHSGSFLNPGEVPIIAQVGEAVLSRAGVAAAGGSPAISDLNSGRKSGSVTNVFIQPNNLYATDTKRVMDEVISDNYAKGYGKVTKIIRDQKGVYGYRSRNR